MFLKENRKKESSLTAADYVSQMECGIKDGWSAGVVFMPNHLAAFNYL